MEGRRERGKGEGAEGVHVVDHLLAHGLVHVGLAHLLPRHDALLGWALLLLRLAGLWWLLPHRLALLRLWCHAHVLHVHALLGWALASLRAGDLL